MSDQEIRAIERRRAAGEAVQDELERALTLAAPSRYKSTAPAERLCVSDYIGRFPVFRVALSAPS